MSEIVIHGAAKIFPPMPEDEFATLKGDIKQRGLDDPIEYIVDDKGRKSIIDGRHRYKALKELKIDPLTAKTNSGKAALVEYKPKKGDSVTNRVFAANFARRHLTPSQKATLGAQLKELYAAEIKEEFKTTPRKPRGAAKDDDGDDDTPPKPKKNARTRAAEATGTSPRNVQNATFLKKERPDLFEQVNSGEKTLNAAMAEAKRDTKNQELQEATKAAPKLKDSMIQVVHGDFLELARAKSIDKKYALIFADPPYNLGVDYGSGKKSDMMSEENYEEWTQEWVEAAANLLAPHGSMFVLIDSTHADMMGRALTGAGLHRRAWIVWYETFGTNCQNNYNRTSRHLFYMTRDARKFTFNAQAVTRQSDRQTKYGDKRANPAGKIWDDVWIIPRLVGTSKERIPEAPTQLPVFLVQTIIEAHSMPGDAVLDPFCGTGTTVEACVTAESGIRHCLGVEKSATWYKVAEERARRVVHAFTEGRKKAKTKAERAATVASNGDTEEIDD